MANATLREILPHEFSEVAFYYSSSLLSKGSQWCQWHAQALPNCHKAQDRYLMLQPGWIV
jgi:hypothetical protein